MNKKSTLRKVANDCLTHTKQSRGITLIALVITIIVLLILAGVSIAMLTGDNGILTQAKEAKEATEEAEKKELKELAQIEANTHLDNYEYITADNIKVPVPAGHAVMEEEGKKVSDGIVIVDARGNEYVWIPCTKEQYKRQEWYVETDGADNSKASKDELTLVDATFSQNDIDNGIDKSITDEIVKQIKEEKASIEKYGGYYIGRYEVGNENNKAVIKPNVEPYAEIKWRKAYDLAKEIGGGTGATTYLCSSYAWDTAINFIQNNGTKNYATSTNDFNENWESKEVKDKNGKVIKPAGTRLRLKTGLTTAKSNIYDMGGNTTEFTTELNPNTSETVVLRGGHCYYHDAAGHRYDYGAGGALSYKRLSSHFIPKVALTTVIQHLNK